MKYYLIVGEASGDLHASHLMTALKAEDPQAEFRFFGGDLMAAVGGTLVKHYKELAYMGFIPVLLHLRTIFANMKRCKEDIAAWQPDVLILVDYPGLNLNIAKFAPCPYANTGVLLYFSQDMGLERAPYQEYQAGCGRTLLHSSVRGGVLRGQAPLSHTLCRQSDGG